MSIAFTHWKRMKGKNLKSAKIFNKNRLITLNNFLVLSSGRQRCRKIPIQDDVVKKERNSNKMQTMKMDLIQSNKECFYVSWTHDTDDDDDDDDEKYWGNEEERKRKMQTIMINLCVWKNFCCAAAWRKFRVNLIKLFSI